MLGGGGVNNTSTVPAPPTPAESSPLLDAAATAAAVGTNPVAVAVAAAVPATPQQVVRLKMTSSAASSPVGRAEAAGGHAPPASPSPAPPSPSSASSSAAAQSSSAAAASIVGGLVGAVQVAGAGGGLEAPADTSSTGFPSQMYPLQPLKHTLNNNNSESTASTTASAVVAPVTVPSSKPSSSANTKLKSQSSNLHSNVPISSTHTPAPPAILLPYKNAYAPRLAHGDTAILTPLNPDSNSIIMASSSSRRASSAAKSYKEIDEDDDDEEDDDNEDDDDQDGNSSQSDDGHDTDGMDIDRPNKKRKRLQGEDPTVAAENAAIKSLLKREKYVTSEHAARLAVTSGSRSVPNEKPKHKRMMRSTRHSYAFSRQRVDIADAPELLVPIRIELDLPGASSILKDTFTWNLNERQITPEKYAELLCEDLNIPKMEYVPTISAAFRRQIQEYSAYFLETDLPVFPDSRIVIQLDINVGRLQLKDRFEWDLSSDLQPEEFARIMAADLGLGGEYVSIIAHSIHEQILKSKMEDDFVMSYPLGHGVRSMDADDLDYWCPSVDVVNQEDLEKMKTENERNARRIRRESRMGASSLTSNMIRRRSHLLPPSDLYGRGPRMQALAHSDIETPTSSIPPADLAQWHCANCKCLGTMTPTLRPGPTPNHPPTELCHSCGMYWVVEGRVPEHRRDLFLHWTGPKGLAGAPVGISGGGGK